MAKGPGGTEVGRVSIRVLPDTSKFHEQLKRELKKIEKSTSISIPVDLDTRKARAQMAQLQAQLKRINGANIGVSVTGNGKTLTSVSKSAKTATNDVITLRNAMNKLKDSFSKATSAIDTGRLKLMFFGDTLKRSLPGRLVTRFGGLLQKMVPDSVKNGISSFASEFNRIPKILDSVGQRLAPIGKRLGNLVPDKLVSGLKKLYPDRLIRGIADADLRFKRLRKTASIFGTSLGLLGKGIGKGVLAPVTGLIGAFGKLGRVGGIVVAVLAAIPVVIGPIATLLAGIPSLLFAIGAAGAAVALGFDGIKKAFAPLKDEVDGLKKSLSATFEKGLAPQVKQLEKIFPILDKGLNQVAKGTITMFQGITNALTSPAGLDNLSIILENTGKFLANLKPFFNDFTAALLQVGAAGSTSFGYLSDSLNKFGAGFRKVFADLTRSGALDSAFQGLAATLDGVFDVLLKLIKSGVEVMSTIGAPLGRALSAISDLVVELMPTLADFANVILDLATTLIEALLPVFEDLAPVFKEFAKNAGALLGPVIKALVPPLGDLIKFALELFNAFSPLFPVIAQLARIFGDVLMTALNAVRPVLPVIAQMLGKVGEVISTALVESAPVLKEIATTLGKVLVTAVEALAPVLPDLIQAFLELVQAVLPILPPLIQLVGDVLPPLIKAIAAVAIPVLQLATKIVNFLMPAIKWLIGVLSDVISWIANFASAIADKIGAAIRFVGELPGKIIGFFKDAGKWLYEAGKQVISGFIDGFSSMIGIAQRMIERQVLGLKTGFKQQMSVQWDMHSPSKFAYKYGAFIPEGMALGIEDGIKRVQGAVGDLAKTTQVTSGFMTSNLNSTGSLDIIDGNIGDSISNALSGWAVTIDKFGLAKLVNQANAQNTRR